MSAIRLPLALVMVVALPSLAQAQFLSDTFTEPTINTVLSSHSAETGGACWVEHGSYADDLSVSEANDRLLAAAGADFGVYYCSVAPASADYEVVGNIFVVSNAAAGYPGVVGRVNTAANTMYRVYYRQEITSWRLEKVVAGVITTLGTDYSQSLTNSQTYALKLEMIGTAIKVYIDGVERISATDSAIAATGRAGVIQYASGSQELTSVTATNSGGAAVKPAGSLLLGGVGEMSARVREFFFPALQAQTVMREYLVPIQTVGCQAGSVRCPKYFDGTRGWSASYYGAEPVVLVRASVTGAQHTALVAMVEIAESSITGTFTRGRQQ